VKPAITGTTSPPATVAPLPGYVSPYSAGSMPESPAAGGAVGSDAIWACVDATGHKIFVTKGYPGCRRIDGLITSTNDRPSEGNARRDIPQAARGDTRLKGSVDPDAPQAQSDSKIDPKFDDLFD